MSYILDYSAHVIDYLKQILIYIINMINPKYYMYMIIYIGDYAIDIVKRYYKKVSLI